MARKKTVIIHEYESSRRGWVLKVSGTDHAVRTDLIEALRTSTKANDIVIANAQDPFAEVEVKVAKKRKPRKPVTSTATQEKV